MKKKADIHYMVSTITEIIFMVISVIIVILIAEYRLRDTDTGKNKDMTLNLWYNDREFEGYFTALAEEYKKETGIKVNIYYKDLYYLEDMSRLCVNGDDTSPDIYMINSENLEAAYGYGLAKKVDDDILNESNFSGNSLTNVTYKKKYVAYPLAADTAFLIYNKKYITEAPRSFDDIINAAVNFDYVGNSSIKQYFYYDVKDTMHNYYFIGAYMNIGGKCGDDESIWEVDKEKLKECGAYYAAMLNAVGLSWDNDYSDSVTKFINGEIVCSIVDMKEFNHIVEKSGENVVDYVTCEIPKLNDSLDTKSLSLTKVLAVNYLSGKTDEAEDLARFAVLERSDLIYEYTGYLPARRVDYANGLYAEIYNQYEAADNCPKLMYLSDYYALMSDVILRCAKNEEFEFILDEIR